MHTYKSSLRLRCGELIVEKQERAVGKLRRQQRGLGVTRVVGEGERSRKVEMRSGSSTDRTC